MNNEKKNYVITIIEVEAQPENWTSKNSWPSAGIYHVIGQDCLYHVGGWSVDYISSAREFFMSKEIDNEIINPKITEDLFLKAIAAAANSQYMKK